MKVLIASGGTYGHYFPALSVAQRLSLEENNKVMMVLDKYRKRKIKHLKNVEVVFIDSMPLRRVLSLQFLYSVVKFIQGIIQSFVIVARYNPDICIGFGSYASFGVVFAAYLNKIPTVIHEQNVVPGKANRLLSYVVNRVLLSFNESRRYFRDPDKIEVTGNPLRPDLRRINPIQARESLGFKKDSFVILVMGGSQGSSKINSLFFESLALLDQEVKDNIAVIHIVGKNEFSVFKDRYNRSSFDIRVFDFFEDMSVVYSACDLLVSRSGAMTVTEIDFFDIRAILVPYPFAGAHQVLNARILVDKNKAVLLEEEKAKADSLAESISGFFFKRHELLKSREVENNITALSSTKVVGILKKIHKENKT